MKSFPISPSAIIEGPFLIGKIIGIIPTSPFPQYKIRFSSHNFDKGLLVHSGVPVKKIFTCFYSEDPLLVLGDVIEVCQDKCYVQLSPKSNDNCLVVNNECNEQCITCPQLSKKYDPYLKAKNKKIIGLLPRNIPSLGLTGGEPTLDIPYLCSLSKDIYRRNPSIHLDILTNGILLSQEKLLSALLGNLKKDTCFCIPFYGDTPSLHDRYTNVMGSFASVTKALHLLALHHQTIEIRFVIDRENCHRLASFIEFIYDNFPFVDHIALMGMEFCGEAEKNAKDLFVQPEEYVKDLFLAVQKAKLRALPVIIFNHLICQLPEPLWKYTQPTISDWKVGYHPACNLCDVKGYCGGFFLTSNPLYTNSPVSPINLDVKSEDPHETCKK